MRTQRKGPRTLAACLQRFNTWGKVVEGAVQVPPPVGCSLATVEEVVVRVASLLVTDDIYKAWPVAGGKLRQLCDDLRQPVIGWWLGKFWRRLVRIEEGGWSWLLSHAG